MRGILAITLSLVLTSSAGAYFSVSVGDTVATFKPSYAYTIDNLAHDDRPYMDIVSGNGAVIKYNTTWEWAGSYHGHETLEQASLTIDGVPEVVGSDAHYTAQNYADFSRTTVLGDGYRLTHDMRIQPHEIAERAHFVGLPSAFYAEVIYGWLGTRANRLTQYAAYDSYRDLIGWGETTANNDSLPVVNMPQGTAAVAQYDPLTGDGIFTQWEVPAGHNTLVFIHDRGGDNKLYLFDLTAVGETEGKDIEVCTSSTFFNLPEPLWREVVSEISAGDFSGDGRLTNTDIELFEWALTDLEAFEEAHPFIVAPTIRGDLNRDGLFNNFDIDYFEARLTDESGTTPVPEPSTLALSVLALPLLLLRRRRHHISSATATGSACAAPPSPGCGRSRSWRRTS